jgi:hypothetical protein
MDHFKPTLILRIEVFYLSFFFRMGEKLFREGKSVVTNAKTVNSGRAKSIFGGAAPPALPRNKTL